MLSRSRKAFTLLELIVVIVILGILAALAIPTFAAVIARARKQTAITAAESFGREVIAVGSFDGVLPVTQADVDEAKADLPTGSTVGALSASNTLVVTKGTDVVTLTFTGNTVKGA